MRASLDDDLQTFAAHHELRVAWSLNSFLLHSGLLLLKMQESVMMVFGDQLKNPSGNGAN